MVHKSLFLLGRQPAIGRAELESLFGSEHLEPIGDSAVACDVPADNIAFDRIGGSIRLAIPLSEVNSTNWPRVAKHLIAALPQHISDLPEGKLKLGVSVFGLQVRNNDLLRTGLEIKKALKRHGRSVRVVPNGDESALNTAQVLHNQLTGTLGVELLCIQHGDKTYIAQTKAIQNIDAYAQRDQGRPKRDPRVGMLPPKLAQTIINLGAGPLEPTPEHAILDPFCGTGVLLQEALLMGYGGYGTDLEPRMIEYTTKNLQWLSETYSTPTDVPTEVGDATTHKWQHPFSAVACETYLGRPLSSWPNPETLQEVVGTCNVIIDKFMRNLAEQIPSGTRLCLAVPAWVSPSGRIKHLSLLDHLDVLGYNRVSFEHAKTEELVYYRPDQIVARELLVITRK